MFKAFEEPSVMDKLLDGSKTLDAKLEQQLREKYRTFSRFNYREAYQDARQRQKRKAEQTKTIEPDIALALQLFLKNSLLSEAQAPEKRGKVVSL
jgi:exonuclease VII large subunit